MGSHLIDGTFQSDKYPTTPRGKVPLSVSDPLAQPLLWEYAEEHLRLSDDDSRFDPEFGEDLKAALLNAGYTPITRCRIDGKECDEHSGVVHGAEAEELRAGLEKICEKGSKELRDLMDEYHMNDRVVPVEKIEKFLEDVDARDSLAWVEARQEKKPKPTAKRKTRARSK